MKKLTLYTLGCKLNYAETATIGKQFIDRGYVLVEQHEQVDLVVINSCSVTAHADRECRQIIRRALRKSPEARIAVVGCYAQLQPDEIAQIKGVNFIIGTQDKMRVADIVEQDIRPNYPSIYVSCIDDHLPTMSASSAGFEDRTRAFIKVQDGCDYTCSYCTIPLARGTSRSITSEKVIGAAREAVEKGYKEIVLTGVNVGTYDDQGSDLLYLLRQLVSVEGLHRIRISSIEPNLLTPELLEFWFSQKRLCKHWHIPLQSGSDTILGKMRRRYSTRDYSERIRVIKENYPDAGIGADVIVGFPGETDALFDETYKFIEETPVSYLHVFSYSKRPTTDALNFAGQIPSNIQKTRSTKLRVLSESKRNAYYKNFIGRTVNILAESEKETGLISGLSEEYIHVLFPAERKVLNEFVHIKILEANAENCRGSLVEN